MYSKLHLEEYKVAYNNLRPLYLAHLKLHFNWYTYFF